jgi:hypothetical protein
MESLNQFGFGEDFRLVQDLVLADSYVCERNNSALTPLLEVCYGILWAQEMLVPRPYSWPWSRSWQRISVKRPEGAGQVWHQQLAEAG